MYGEHLPPLSDKRKTTPRMRLSELKLIIMDEVSMVSNIRLKHLHERLTEMFGTPDSLLFAGLSVIVVGDFYQLPNKSKTHLFIF